MLYGVSPFSNTVGEEERLRPVMTLRTQLSAVKRVPKGGRVGYGGTWQCPESMLLGVAAIGYGDGYPRHLPSGTPVLLNGTKSHRPGRRKADTTTCGEAGDAMHTYRALSQ